MLRDSSGPLLLFENILIRKSLTIQFNICGKISAQVFEISSQWFPKGQPEKVLCLIIGYDETLIKGNLFKMHL